LGNPVGVAGSNSGEGGRGQVLKKKEKCLSQSGGPFFGGNVEVAQRRGKTHGKTEKDQKLTAKDWNTGRRKREMSTDGKSPQFQKVLTHIWGWGGVGFEGRKSCLGVRGH